MPTRVFVDANVLFARVVRDWMFLLRNVSGGGMFTLGSSEDVLAETVARFRDSRPMATGGQITRLRLTLEESLDELQQDFSVEEWMLERDPGDGHVRGACVAGQYDMLLTFDTTLLADRDHTLGVPYEPIHPDDFFILVDESGPEYVRTVVGLQLDYLATRTPQADLAARLDTAGCPLFAQRVRGLLAERAR